jgi:hypothetical protein
MGVEAARPNRRIVKAFRDDRQRELFVVDERRVRFCLILALRQ